MTIAILLAAGKGIRFSSELPKQFHEHKGKSLLAYSLETLLAISELEKLILVFDKDFEKKLSGIEVIRHQNNRVVLVRGGLTRSESLLRGLEAALSIDHEIHSNFLIHDAARPFVSSEHFKKFLSEEAAHEVQVTSARIYDAYAVRLASGKFRKSKDEEIVVFQTPISLNRKVAVRVTEQLSKELNAGLAGLLIDLNVDLTLVESDGTTAKITFRQDLHDV